jgi:hypothetical protein
MGEILSWNFRGSGSSMSAPGSAHVALSPSTGAGAREGIACACARVLRWYSVCVRAGTARLCAPAAPLRGSSSAVDGGCLRARVRMSAHVCLCVFGRQCTRTHPGEIYCSRPLCPTPCSRCTALFGCCTTPTCRCGYGPSSSRCECFRRACGSARAARSCMLYCFHGWRPLPPAVHCRLPSTACPCCPQPTPSASSPRGTSMHRDLLRIPNLLPFLLPLSLLFPVFLISPPFA